MYDNAVEERIKDGCKGGVDVVIDFVSSTRTVNCVTNVLNKARDVHIIKEVLLSYTVTCVMLMYIFYSTLLFSRV